MVSEFAALIPFISIQVHLINYTEQSLFSKPSSRLAAQEMRSEPVKSN
jgi:hypothetical protein